VLWVSPTATPDPDPTQQLLGTKGNLFPCTHK
jgi:hypothetical protein